MQLSNMAQALLQFHLCRVLQGKGEVRDIVDFWVLVIFVSINETQQYYKIHHAFRSDLEKNLQMCPPPPPQVSIILRKKLKYQNTVSHNLYSVRSARWSVEIVAFVCKPKCEYEVTNRDVELGLVSRPTCKVLLRSSPSKTNASQLASSLIKMIMLMMEFMATMMLMRSSPSNASQLGSSLMTG